MDRAKHPQIERCVLYALMTYPGLEEKIFKIPSTAFNGPNKLLFDALRGLWDSKKSLDTASVLSLGNDEIDLGFIVEIYNQPEIILDSANGGVYRNIDAYIDILLEDWTKNRILQTIGEHASFPEILAKVQELEQAGDVRSYDSDTMAQKVFESLHQQDKGMSFGYRIIDRNSQGLRKGDIVIVAGRPGAGKSSFMHNLAIDWLVQDKKILFASAEMSAEMIAKRMLSTISGRNLFIDNITLSDKDNEAFDKLSRMPFFVGEVSSIPQIEQLLRDKITEVDVVFVDYLQLIEPSKKYKTLYERATFAINELVLMAKKYNIPFVIASQYSRNAETTQPSMADLRDSGQIEQSADMIISLWSKKEDKLSNGMQKVYVDILKNRNGSTAINGDYVYALWFRKHLFEFIDMEVKYD